MSGRVLVEGVVTTLVLLLTVTEAIVVAPQPPTVAPDFRNCNESVKLVPILRLVTPEPTSPSPTSNTLPPPHTTTQPLLYTQSHSTTPLAAHTTTNTHHPQQPTPTLFKTKKTTLAPNKHATIHGKQNATQHPKKHDPFTATMNTPQLPPHAPQHMNFPSSSSSSSTSPTAPPPPHHVTVPQPNLPPRTSTLPPPSPTLPLPTAPPTSTTPTPMLTLQQLGEKMKSLLGKQIPLALTSGWAKEFQRPYLERIRAVNHEIVDKVLQAEYEEYEPDTWHSNTTNITTCHLPERRLSHLFDRQTLLLLLLQALPQSLEEVEEAMWIPEITDYIFRPEKKAVFDVYGCRQCYALDASGVCREVFFCKDGQNVFSRTSRRRPMFG